MGLGTGSTSSDLAWYSNQPYGGGGSGTSDGGGGGGCAKSGCPGVQGWRKKVFAPMTWDALSEARRVPPQETVIWGRSGDSCACRYNTDIYIRYIHIHAIQTHTYIDPPAKIDLS